MMKNKNLVIICLIILFTVNSCAFFEWVVGDPSDEVEKLLEMTDEQIRKEIERLGGKVLDKKNQDLKGFIIDPYESGISIIAKPTFRCNNFIWSQVVRERIDGIVVKDPTSLPDPDSSSEKGKRAYWKKKITEDGFVVDGGADGKGLEYPLSSDPNTFQDVPYMPNEDLIKNTLKPNARLYTLEVETCVKCRNPATDYLECIKWYYVHIRGKDKPDEDKTYLITLDKTSKPSDDFKKAVNKWKN